MNNDRKKQLSDFLVAPPFNIKMKNGKTWNIYNQAFTHSTYAKEKRDQGIECKDYERLEFLGDKVLGLVVGNYLFINDKFDSEGKMTKQMEVVSNEILAEIIKEKKTGVKEMIPIGKGESIKDSIIANAFDALNGAIYLENNCKKVNKIILDLLSDEILKYNPSKNYKSRLQEYTQKKKLPIPEYSVTSKIGPDHSPEYKSSVKIQGKLYGEGEGRKIQEAEKEAAKAALKKIEK